MTDPAPTPKASADRAFWRNTAARFGTAVVGIPILLWLMFLGPWWAFQLVAGACIALAGHELMRMTMKAESSLYLVGVASTLAILVLSIVIPAWLPTALVVHVSLALFASLLRPEPHDVAGQRMAWLVAGPLYVAIPLASVGRLHLLPHGGQWVLLSMWIAWAGDTGAYFAGRYFGKHKLYPKVSPSKTVEGGLGGLLGSLTGGLAAHFWFLPDLPLLDAVLLSILGGAAGQLGDLVESLVKRSVGAKDSGNVLPGHGGMLDRVDALMFTATACFLYNVLVRGAEPSAHALLGF